MSAVNFSIMGEGDPLIIIHGLFGTSDNLKQVAKSLSDSYKVYLIDSPAHGGSETVIPLTINNMASQVVSFCEQQQLNKVAILGHSLGGKIAMEIALSQPQLISKLIVADIAPVQYQSRHNAIIQALNAVPLADITSRKQADDVLKHGIPEMGVRAFLLKSLIKNSDNQWSWNFDLANLSHYYPELIKANRTGSYDGPTLFVIGGQSDYVNQSHQQQIQQRFSNIKVKVIENAGHWLHAEKPVAFNKICADFLAQ